MCCCSTKVVLKCGRISYLAPSALPSNISFLHPHSESSDPIKCIQVSACHTWFKDSCCNTDCLLCFITLTHRSLAPFYWATDPICKTFPQRFKIRIMHLMLLTQSSWASVRVLMCLDEIGSNSRTSVCSQATVSTDLIRRKKTQLISLSMCNKMLCSSKRKHKGKKENIFSVYRQSNK